MRRKVFWVLVAACVVVPASAVSASEWEPEREYSQFAVTADDEIRYGGYNVDEPTELAFIDVLDEKGDVIEVLQLPAVEGWNTRLYDLVTNGDQLIAFYHLHLVGGDPFFEITDRYMLSLFEGGEEIARGGWGKHPYGSYGRDVAFSGEYVFVEYTDSGVPEDPRAVIVDGIPEVASEVNEISDIESVPWLMGDFEWGDLYPGQDTAVDLSAGGEALYFYWDASIDVYSLGPSGPEYDHTVTLSGLDPPLAIVDADHGPDGSFVLSGRSPEDVEWCSIWTHASDGSFKDCFMSRLGGAETLNGQVDPFDVDGCGGIVVADVEADNGVLTGYKFIPSDRDPGCFVDSFHSTFVSNIEVMGRSGVTKGCNPSDNDRYCPDDFVTRGQMAAFLVRALELPATNLNIFSDDEGNTFEDDINRLAAALITFGCGTGGNPWTNTYCPDDYVTRGQMAAFLVRAFELPAAGEDYFTDDTGNTFESDINRLAEAGITRGCNPPSNDRFCPDGHVTRGQMAAFLDRALND
jgi:hypothetical protein